MQSAGPVGDLNPMSDKPAKHPAPAKSAVRGEDRDSDLREITQHYDSVEAVEKRFAELKKQEDYGELGWFFWNGYCHTMNQKDSPVHKALRRAHNSLTKKEKNFCEQV